MTVNSNPDFMVGNSMTIADISWGAWLLRYAYSECHHVHKEIYGAEVKKFPKVEHWANKTIYPNFGEWYKNEPLGIFKGNH